ncbi:MAG TPA: uracil-DNA glycosylase [Firmicutes bacterium]|nr:uracil-DNA glycosylase [Bacillota bacterium]
MLEKLWQECKECRACHLRDAAATKVVPWEAGSKTKVMFVSEAPGRVEDELGIPFQGSAGQIFDKIVAALGLVRGRDTHVTNVVKCRPPKNRTPTEEECQLCGGLFLAREIELVQPRAIICFGKTAAEYILQSKSSSLAKLRQAVHSRRGIPVGVTYHPAYLLYNRKRERDIKWAMWEDITAALSAGGVAYHSKERQR